MDDYISRKALIAAFVKLTSFESAEKIKRACEPWHKQNEWIGGVNDCIAETESIPPADVRPVVRGEWVDKCVRDWHCSLCDYNIQKIRNHDGYIYKDLPNFCPCCGADMRPEHGTGG